MSDITLTIRLFGAFREHGQQLALSLPQGATAADVKAALASQLPAEATLIHDSALADDAQVLDEHAIFSQDAMLAILPPVCGG